MAMTKGKHRFESEVRLGLLIIIFILLLLNAASNYVVYKARTSKTDVVMAELTEAATSIGYYLRSESSSELSRVQIDNLKSQFGLSGLIIIPSGPGEDSPQVKAKWFARIAGQLPAGQIPEIARKLLTSDYNSLTRGRNSEYFMVHPADLPSGRRLIILSQNSPDLAYLDGNGRFILIMSIIFIIMIAALYLMLYRHILSPFNQIRRQAQDAGREVGEDNSDVESVVEEYRDLIQELRDKEGQLLKLNAAIRRKADSLEQFNQYLLESMSSGVATVDQQGRILSVNRVAAETMQADSELLVGRHYGELFGPNWSISTAVKATLEENRNQP
ncbi:MAG: PAS domain-containing protein, partial [candidate division Zixibacteria bacterium]|nr:PAS domain-containing protein [candidate division Zixibacteria bacterium]